MAQKNLCFFVMTAFLTVSRNQTGGKSVYLCDKLSYRDINKVDTLTASSALRRLRDAGLFRQEGRGSATRYLVTEKLTGTEEGQCENADGLSGKSGSLSGKSGSLSGKSGSLSGKSGSLSGKSGSLSGKSESLSGSPNDVARNQLLNELPGFLAARVGTIGMRHPPDMVRELVHELCHVRAWRVDELALLLERNPKTISQYYLRPLLVQNRIVMTLPDTPNSPLQSYRAKEDGKQ